MDRDEGAIGGLEKPPLPTIELLRIVTGMDILAIALGFLVSPWFALGTFIYILASRAYSSRITRLKKYPVIGYLVVIICQGGLIFWMVYHGSHQKQPMFVPLSGCIASSLLLGGAYPLTQIYQYEADASDGVKTISMLVGKKGTFILSGLLFTLAFMVLAFHFGLQLELDRFIVLMICFLPVLAYFLRWAKKVFRDQAEANFQNLMRMNLISSVCANTGFLIILIWKIFD